MKKTRLHTLVMVPKIRTIFSLRIFSYSFKDKILNLMPYLPEFEIAIIYD